METISNATIDTTATLSEIIAENFCKQITAFQNAIANREPGQQFPTQQEMGLLFKLVNCVTKMRKIAAPVHNNKAIKTFVNFLLKDNNDLSKIVNRKYKEYIQGGTITGEDITPTPSANKDNTPETTSSVQAIVPVSTTQPIPEVINRKYPLRFRVPTGEKATTPPITEAEFAKYKHLLLTLNEPRQHQTEFRGNLCNTNWLQYNLFQFYLPAEDRNFVAKSRNYHNILNHTIVVNTISDYLIDHNIKLTA